MKAARQRKPSDYPRSYFLVSKELHPAILQTGLITQLRRSASLAPARGHHRTPEMRSCAVATDTKKRY